MKTRKWLSFSILILLLLVTSIAFAESARITWKQSEGDLPFVKEWVVYVGDAANPTTELTRIPYDGAATGAYTSVVPITITAGPGTTVRKYISIAAVSKNGNISPAAPGQTAAGVGYLEFSIPIPNVAAPFEVIIQIVTP